jgi:hypothetical protein
MSDLPAWPDDLMAGAEACDEFRWLNESLTAAMARIEALVERIEGRELHMHREPCQLSPRWPTYQCTCGLDDLLAACRRKAAP